MTVTPEMISLALGRTASTDAEALQWQMWVDDARLLIEARLGDLDKLDQAKLDYVVREAVVSHIRHPDDATQVTVSIDDASSSRSYRPGKGRVTILDEWWKLLSPEDLSGAFAIDTAPGFGSVHAPWCSASMGANYCSCGADIAGFPIFGAP